MRAKAPQKSVNDLKKHLSSLKKQKSKETAELEEKLKKCKYKMKKLSSERSIAKAERQASLERIIRWSNFVVYYIVPRTDSKAIPNICMR